MKKSKKEKVMDDYLSSLEEVKEQYEQYVEVSKLYELPTHTDEKVIQYRPPSVEHPLTTNVINIG
jgi:hypothetical protein